MEKLISIYKVTSKKVEYFELSLVPTECAYQTHLAQFSKQIKHVQAPLTWLKKQIKMQHVLMIYTIICVFLYKTLKYSFVNLSVKAKQKYRKRNNSKRQ